MFSFFIAAGGKIIYLTSAKLEGRSTIRAPPNNGVLRKVAMSQLLDWLWYLGLRDSRTK